MPRSERLESPLERDLDRVRKRGLNRISTADPSAWEALPDLALFGQVEREVSPGQTQWRRATLYALVIRKLLQRATEALGNSRMGAAAQELFGLGEGPSEAALASYGREATDLVRREIAAAERYGDVTPSHFRQQIGRKLVVPELARAILELNHEYLNAHEQSGLGTHPLHQRRPGDGLQELRGVLLRHYADLPKLTTLAETVLPLRVPYTDVAVRYALSDHRTAEGTYTLRSSFSFTAQIEEYVIALTSSAVIAEVIASECPRVSDFHTCSDYPALKRLGKQITAGNGISLVQMSDNSRGRTVQKQLPLELIDDEACAEYLEDLPEELHKDVVLFRASVTSAEGFARLVCTVDTTMQKSDHYCYWVADRPMFVSSIEFDTASFTTTERGLTLQPFLGNMASEVIRTHGTYRIPLSDWIVAGQGAVLVW